MKTLRVFLLIVPLLSFASCCCDPLTCHLHNISGKEIVVTYEGEEVRLADGETASFKERDRVGIEFDGEALTYAIPTPFRERSTPDDLMANRNGRFFVAFCKDKTIRLKGAEHGGGLRPSEANAATDLDEFLNKVEGYPVRPIEP